MEGSRQGKLESLLARGHYNRLVVVYSTSLSNGRDLALVIAVWWRRMHYNVAMETLYLETATSSLRELLLLYSPAPCNQHIVVFRGILLGC